MWLIITWTIVWTETTWNRSGILFPQYLSDKYFPFLREQIQMRGLHLNKYWKQKFTHHREKKKNIPPFDDISWDWQLFLWLSCLFQLESRRNLHNFLLVKTCAFRFWDFYFIWDCESVARALQSIWMVKLTWQTKFLSRVEWPKYCCFQLFTSSILCHSLNSLSNPNSKSHFKNLLNYLIMRKWQSQEQVLLT